MLSRAAVTSRLLLVFQTLFLTFGVWMAGVQVASGQDTWTTLPTLPTSSDTSTTVQSKAWFHGHTWWAILPSNTPSSGQWVFRLEPNNTWTPVLKVSTLKGRADAKASGDLTHILIVSSSAQVVTIEYVPALNTYQLWPGNPTPTSVFAGETGTLEVDSTGRLWLATDHFNWVYVYYSDPPFSSFTGPTILTDQTGLGDVNSIVAFPNHSIGVFWGNAALQKWGFRYHEDGTDPEQWSADEEPAYAGHAGMHMADDHINLALGSDGTLYAVVKSNRTSSTIPALYLLVRRPQPGGFGGTWDNTLYPIDPSSGGSESGSGRRPIVVLNEDTHTLRVIYHDSAGTVWVRESDASVISFGPRTAIFSGGFEYASSTKDQWAGRLVVLATHSGTGSSLLTTTPDLVGYWKMEEGGGTKARDLSGWGNDASLVGSPTWTPGAKGLAINLNGSTSYGLVSDQANLDATTGLTLSAWIKPGAQGNQDIISRAILGSVDGYTLGLSPSSPGTVFMQLNEATTGNAYRLDSLTHYPFNGNTWMHVAATYDGTTMRMYINGVEEQSNSGPSSIAANLLNLGIGAQSDGARRFRGHLDEVRIYRRALSASEIVALATVPQADLVITKSDSVSSVVPGQQTTYSIQASNLGPSNVVATISDVLSSKLTGATWTCTASGGATCTASGSGSLDNLVSLPAGGSVSYMLQATVASSASGTLVNTATVVAANAMDPVAGNNSATDTDTIQGTSSPQITTQPANVTVTAPAAASFSVVATGTAPLSYQWRRNGAPIGGATSSSYVLNPTAVGDNGAQFSVVVSNSAGSLTSSAATLTVNAAPVPPSITTPPANQTVPTPAPASFSVVAAGTAPLSYQWRRNGAPIAGATSTSYILNPTAVSDSGASFDVVVSNSVGTATSAAATLTVYGWGGGGGVALIDAHFDTDTDSFAYADDVFREYQSAELRQRRANRHWGLHRRRPAGRRRRDQQPEHSQHVRRLAAQLRPGGPGARHPLVPVSAHGDAGLRARRIQPDAGEPRRRPLRSRAG